MCDDCYLFLNICEKPVFVHTEMLCWLETYWLFKQFHSRRDFFLSRNKIIRVLIEHSGTSAIWCGGHKIQSRLF